MKKLNHENKVGTKKGSTKEQEKKNAEEKRTEENQQIANTSAWPPPSD